jgi:glycine/D-amino acid oxidase-like deaminating enzyme
LGPSVDQLPEASSLFQETVFETVHLDKSEDLLEKMKFRLANVEWCSTPVHGIEETSSEVILNLKDHSISAEICVLANGTRIAQLLPKFKDVLIPLNDILMEWRLENAVLKNDSVVLSKDALFAARGNSGHVSLVFDPSRSALVTTGPRFLSISAGKTHSWEKFHREQTLPFLFCTKGDSVFSATLTNSTTLCDVLPCDELPVVGELGRLGRVFGSTGFFGYGLSAQSHVAQRLAENIGGTNALSELSFLSPSRLAVY